MKNINLITRFGVAIAIILGFTSLAHADGVEISLSEARGRAGWVANNLDIVINAQGSTPTYSGTMTVTSEVPSSKGPVFLLNNREVSMSLQSMEIIGDKGELPSYQIETDVPNPTGRKSSLIVITFDKPVEQGTEFTVSFEYEFITQQGQVLSRPSKGYEDFPTIHYASWVTGWHPYLVADSESLVSQGSLAMPGITKFLLPKELASVSNGRIIEETDEGDFKTQTWKTGKLARSYAIGPFNVSTVGVGDVDVSMYMLSDDKANVEFRAKQLAQILKFQQSKFGDYPFDAMGLVEFPNRTSDYFEGASEQGFIIATSNSFTNEYGLSLFSHEMGHAWWQNKFSCSGKGASLCGEALAEFGARITYEELFGDAIMRDYMEASVADYWPAGSIRGYFAMWRAGEDVAISEQVDGWKVHRIINPKGAWIWQMLREEIGDEQFFSILKTLPTLGEELSLQELGEYFTLRSGQDLSNFFDQWLNRAGTPVINMDWTVTNASMYVEYRDKKLESVLAQWKEDPKTIEIILTQEQQELYKLKMEVEVQYYYRPSETQVVELNERQKVVTIKTEGRVRNVMLDPGRKILMWRPAYGPKPKL